MSGLWPLIIVIIILTAIGAAALPAFLPPVRRLCWRSATTRIAIICILAFVSFVVSFGLCTRMNAEVAYIFGTITIVEDFVTVPSPSWPPDVNKPSVVNELWIQFMLPPPLRGFCYAQEATVCELANNVTLAISTHENWMNFLTNIGISFVSAATSSGLAWLFTRQRHVLAQTA